MKRSISDTGAQKTDIKKKQALSYLKYVIVKFKLQRTKHTIRFVIGQWYLL